MAEREQIRLRWWLSILGVAILGAGYALGAAVHGTDPRGDGEYGIDHWFATHRNPVLNGVARTIELVVGPKGVPFLLLGALVLLFVFGRRISSWMFVVMAGIAWFPGHIAKLLFIRKRPPTSFEPVVVYHDTMSFPSGHTGFATSMSMAVLMLAGVWGISHRTRRVLAWLMPFFIVLVGVSRLYAAAHWPLDVLGGFLLAMGASLIIWTPLQWVYGKLDKSHFWSESERHAGVVRPTE